MSLAPVCLISYDAKIITLILFISLMIFPNYQLAKGFLNVRQLSLATQHGRTNVSVYMSCKELLKISHFFFIQVLPTSAIFSKGF